MSLTRRVLRFLKSLIRRDALEREMTEEMAYHLEREVEDRVRSGLSPAEARRTALRDFGGVERWKEEARSSRGLGGWDAVRQDVRYAARTLRGSPAFTAVAVATLTVAIGATTAVFGVAEALLLEPLDYREPDRVVRLLEFREGSDRVYGTTSGPNFRDWIATAETLGPGVLYDEYAPTLRLGDRSMKVPAASVGAAYFDVLGVEPALGRFFLPEEDEPGSARVVLSWGLWQEVFGGDPAVVGRTVELSSFAYTVVGVARPFEDPGLSGSSFDVPRLWRSTPTYFGTLGRNSRSLTGLARLEPGATVAEAEAELNAIHAGLAEEYGFGSVYSVQVKPVKEVLVGDLRPVLRVLGWAVALVLLIACANVANLLLFRSAGRAREIGVRTALGASRSRVVRQLLVESLLLGVAGAAGGIALAFGVNRGLRWLAAGQLPRVENLGLDPLVLAFAVCAGLGAAILFGLVPALHTVRPGISTALREGGRGSAGTRGQGRLRSAVVAAQVGLAVVVLLGAGLLTRSLLRLAAVDPGVATEDVLVLRIDPPFDPYGPTQEDGGAAMTAVLDRVLERVAAVPGVEAVSTVDLLPMTGSFDGNVYQLEGQPDPTPENFKSAEARAVGPGYFGVHGLEVVQGRDVAPSDRADAPRVAWVNRELARREGLTGDVVGSRVRLFNEDWYTIAGVVEDVTHFTLDAAPGPSFYLPRPQAPLWKQDEPWLVVRAAVDPASLGSAVRSAIAEVDPAIPVYDMASMDDVRRATLVTPRFRTVLLLAFGGVAFLLAAIGVYGMVAYTVARRRAELGVRMALGATSAGIRRLVVREALRPVLLGAAAGLLAALLAVRILAAFLFGVSATDPITFVVAPALLTAMAAFAAWLPARRAARTAPQEVLRLD